MKYRTRKIIEHIVDIALLVIVVISVGILFMKMKNLNNINYKRLYRKAERNPRIEIDYYNGTKQLSKSALIREHPIYIGDLEFTSVDPLSSEEFENGKWSSSKVSSSSKYYRDGSKLSSSTPHNIVYFSDDNYDYLEKVQKYNELIADVRKPLEYKDDSKKKKKENSLWGRRAKRDKERDKKETKPKVDAVANPVITPKPFAFTTAAELHTKALDASQGSTVNLYPTKIVTLPTDASYMGREGIPPQGNWNDPDYLKLYLIPVGIHKLDDYENVSSLLDAVVSVLKQDTYHVFTWSEVEYFERWYKYKDTEERAAVKALVTSGQFEFLLGGWSLFEPEGVYQDDLINQYEEAQRWLYEEFGYRCPVAYLQPSYRVYRNLASILHDSGIEMLLLNGADNTIYNDLLSKKSVEFLWETSPFSTFESRLFTHISSSTSSSLWSVIKQVLNDEGDNAIQQFIQQVTQEVEAYHGKRYLLLWPIESTTDYSNMYSFLNKISSYTSSSQLTAAATSCYTYLLNVNGDSSTKLSILKDSFIELHPLHQTTLYSAFPYLHERLHLGSRFLSIFERFYAFCAIQGTCSNVPAVTPDSAFYSGNNYLPTGKPEDPIFYALHQARRLQASFQQHSLLYNNYDPSDREASRVYYNYDHSMLAYERQAGRMFTTLIGIGERVSPNEVNEDSIYSIYHRTCEWTKKKEIGVMVFNSFPLRAKELIRLRVATSDLCAFNGKMKARHQITQIAEDEYELLLSVKLAPHSYTTYILRWCEGNDKLEGEAGPVQGKFLDGDVYRIFFDESGRFTNVTTKFDATFYDMEMELGIITPLSDNPTHYQPHGLLPTDPLYINPYIKRIVPKTEVIPHSAMRGGLMNLMIHHYSSYATIVTRFVRSIGIDKKSVGRGHLLDCTINIKKKPDNGDLVLYFRLKDIHNQHIIHTEASGMEYVPIHTADYAEPLDPAYLEQNVVPATTGAYIQDEDIDRTKGDISRLSAYFTSTRGITTMEEGSLVFPLTVTGIKSESKEEEDEESEEEEIPQYDMNRGFQQIAFSIQRSEKGVFTLNEKIFPTIEGRNLFFMYFNNTKENKDNPNLKLQQAIMKPNLPPQLHIMSFKKINSLNNRYLLRLQNTAEYNDGFNQSDNIITLKLEDIIKGLRLKFVEEVTNFGVLSKEEVEKQRFIWTAEDGSQSSGSVRPLNNLKSVTFLPLQIRTFVLSND